MSKPILRRGKKCHRLHSPRVTITQPPSRLQRPHIRKSQRLSMVAGSRRTVGFCCWRRRRWGSAAGAGRARAGICAQLAGFIADPRDPTRVIHTLPDILRARVPAIGCVYRPLPLRSHLHDRHLHCRNRKLLNQSMNPEPKCRASTLRMPSMRCHVFTRQITAGSRAKK